MLLLGVVLVALPGCGDDNDVTELENTIQVAIAVDMPSIDTGHETAVSASAVGSGSALTYRWVAAGGRFGDSEAASTTWTAPDTPGTYALSVIVTDNLNVGIGGANVDVAQYVPTDKPSYRGAVVCAGCHSSENQPGGADNYNPWLMHPHSTAIDTLAGIGQDQNASCLGCHTVGTNGLFADASLDNGGYDESAVPRLAGVQCENCHGPGSEHPGADFSSVEVSMDAAVCGNCHTDAHHPTYDEWLESGHSTPVAFAAGRASCAKCHNGVEGPRYLDDPQNYTNPSEDPSEIVAHTCAVCHDPHGNENPHQLRNASVTDVVLPNAVLVEAAGAGRLCMSCHNGRRTEENVEDMINEGSGHFGPHHSVQGDMLAGVNAYEDLAPDFSFTSSKHILVEDACVTCHTHAHTGDLEHGIPNFTGHNFEPTVEACESCHGELDDFSDVTAKEDFDGDGVIEGVQEEVNGLASILEQAIVDTTATAEGRAALEEDFEGAVGDATITTREQREAAYNWAFVVFDGSHGVHNASYSVQLLQQSILYVDDAALPASAIMLED